LGKRGLWVGGRRGLEKKNMESSGGASQSQWEDGTQKSGKRAVKRDGNYNSGWLTSKRDKRFLFRGGIGQVVCGPGMKSGTKKGDPEETRKGAVSRRGEKKGKPSIRAKTAGPGGNG